MKIGSAISTLTDALPTNAWIIMSADASDNA
jgi:hypothetical protein